MPISIFHEDNRAQLTLAHISFCHFATQTARNTLQTLSIARHAICGHHELFRLALDLCMAICERRHFRQSRLFKYYSDWSHMPMFVGAMLLASNIVAAVCF